MSKKYLITETIYYEWTDSDEYDSLTGDEAAQQIKKAIEDGEIGPLRLDRRADVQYATVEVVPGPCQRCGGRGNIVNPAISDHGADADMGQNWGPVFRVQCPSCHGIGAEPPRASEPK